jgi:two-component system response regulator YesN
MYRVMIVDDEEPVLESFSFIIQRDIESFLLCGKARSGTEAIRMAAEEKPDLIFMDIQMPGMDGVEAITRIREQYPNIIFILATAYERFDIAQRVIPLGVFSYLVKPISRKTLISEFQRIKAHLDQSRQKTDLHLSDALLLQKTKDDEKEKFLSALQWGNPSEQEWNHFSSLFSLRGERGTVCIIEIIETLPASSKEKLYTKINERLQFKYNCFHLINRGRLVLFFPEEQSLTRLDFHIQEATADIEPTNLRIGRGEIYPVNQLGLSYQEAEEPFRKSPETGSSFLNEKNTMDNICRHFIRADLQQGLTIFEDFWTGIFKKEDFQVAKAKMVVFFSLLFSQVDSQVLLAGNLTAHPAEEIMGLSSVQEWQRWSSEMLSKYTRLVSSHREKNFPYPLVNALAIIHKRYSEPIQLSSVAAECKITPGYLSRLFSEHLATSFTDYLNRFRIDQSLVLLREKNLSVKEAAYKVGYQDPNYFARIFRRFVGMAPSELINRRINDE